MGMIINYGESAVHDPSHYQDQTNRTTLVQAIAAYDAENRLYVPTNWPYAFSALAASLSSAAPLTLFTATLNYQRTVYLSTLTLHSSVAAVIALNDRTGNILRIPVPATTLVVVNFGSFGYPFSLVLNTAVQIRTDQATAHTLTYNAAFFGPCLP